MSAEEHLELTVVSPCQVGKWEERGEQRSSIVRHGIREKACMSMCVNVAALIFKNLLFVFFSLSAEPPSLSW